MCSKTIWRVIQRLFMISCAISLLAITACEDSESAYDRGYNDGYAVGYNTTCEIRATLIAGDWDNRHYSRGYADGQTDGTIACNNERRAERIR